MSSFLDAIARANLQRSLITALGVNPGRWSTAYELTLGRPQHQRRKAQRILAELAGLGRLESRRVAHESKNRGGMIEYKLA